MRVPYNTSVTLRHWDVVACGNAREEKSALRWLHKRLPMLTPGKMFWMVIVLLDAVEVCKKLYSWSLGRPDCSKHVGIQTPCAALTDHLCTFPLTQEGNLFLGT